MIAGDDVVFLIDCDIYIHTEDMLDAVADVTVERIGDLLTCDVSALPGSTARGRGREGRT